MKICIDPKVLDARNHWEEYKIDFLLGEIASCVGELKVEMTPIEQIVFFVLSEYAEEEGWGVIPQAEINNYRVDFLINNCHLSNREPSVRVVVECDGHDFHERTKEQAIRDKRRDRDLQALGYKVFRFSGSEIWKTTGLCVIDSLGIQRHELVRGFTWLGNPPTKKED